jgi:hypothetical protein
MDPVALAVLMALVLLVLLVCGGLVRVVGSARAARRRAAHATALARQEEVAALTARVDRLSAEVERARREREGHGREYVITTLREAAPAGLGPGGDERLPDVLRDETGGSAGALLQQRLVTAIRRGTADRPAEQALVSLAVRTVAVGHGVRRALSADNRDRIAWEMRRATRHSRRVRKQEVRAARREARARRVASARRDAA